MEWTEVRIYTESEGVEALCAVLMEQGAGAVQIEDTKEMKAFLAQDERNWDYIDEELMEREETVYVQIYLTADDEGKEIFDKIVKAIDVLKSADLGINMGSLEIEYRTVNDEDWVNNWKKYYKPLEIGKRIVVKPQWEEYENTGEKLVFTINPGHLFGTGLHQTTQLCIESIENIVDNKSTVLDLGCGSGILSIISLLLGAQRAFAVDLEPGCVKVVEENALMNDIDLSKYTVRHGNVLSDKPLIDEIKKEKYSVVVANIVADVIIALLDTVKAGLDENGRFIASGIIDSRLDDVKNALHSKGFEVVDVNFKEGWVCVVSRLKGQA